MSQPIKILHLEDVRSDAEMVARELNKAGFKYELLWVTNKKKFEQALKDFVPDVILSDHSLPSFNSVQAFDIVKKAGITVPFILITATISEEFAVSRIKDGVADYLLKDRLERLPTAITNALEKHRAESDRQRFLDDLVENNRLLRRTEKLARIGSWKRDLITGKLHWSDEIFTMLGYEPNEVIPSSELTIRHVHPDDMALYVTTMQNAVENGHNSKTTLRIIDKHGNIKWIYRELVVEHNAHGQAISLNGFNQDITEQKKAEEAHKKSEANLTAIVENTAASIYSIDTNFRYLTFNSVLKNSLKQFYGLNIKTGDVVFDFLNKLEPDEAKQWERIYSEAFLGKPLQFVKEFNVGGIRSFLSFSINPIWENSKVTGLSCFVLDITPLKMAELEVIAVNESLEKKVKERTAELYTANKELEAFSYTVAHDLRAPLRVTNGFVGILLKEHSTSLNDEGKYLLNVITESARQMSQLVSDLLELSRVGKVTISPTTCNMQQIVQQACDATKAADSNFKALITLHKIDDAKCDPNLIKQVWLNLISNAVKYSGKVEKPLIEIGSTVDKKGIVYYIKDNGAGFDMALSEKLFRPFQRLHKKSDYEGTGVGLALSQLIVSKHGGEIWAQAEVGKGATFFFNIPD